MWVVWVETEIQEEENHSGDEGERGVGEDVKGGGGGEGEKRTIKTVTDETKSTTIPKYRLQPASRSDSQRS